MRETPADLSKLRVKPCKTSVHGQELAATAQIGIEGTVPLGPDAVRRCRCFFLALLFPRQSGLWIHAAEPRSSSRIIHIKLNQGTTAQIIQGHLYPLRHKKPVHVQLLPAKLFTDHARCGTSSVKIIRSPCESRVYSPVFSLGQHMQYQYASAVHPIHQITEMLNVPPTSSRY
ncbi:hypothetical protein B0H12DRAFT_408298 [Mycena haematopus]|nr:hypothetical protein B0H12DRAFT_408298 [Mycena haematopus]